MMMQLKMITWGMVFKVIISLEVTSLSRQGRVVQIRSGMTVAVEVKIGERRIIEYFLTH